MKQKERKRKRDLTAEIKQTHTRRWRLMTVISFVVQIPRALARRIHNS